MKFLSEARHLRRCVLLAAGAAVATLAGCVAPSPLPQLVRLRPEPPVAVRPSPPSPVTWQLMLPVRVPDYLDRDALLLPQGQSGLQALAGHRWAEPLADSVPRLLRQDLALLLGEAQVWAAPLPPGLAVQRQLRVELLAFEATSDRSAVQLRARWSVADLTRPGSARAEAALISVPSAGADIDSLVAAHRLALWQLAERIAAGGWAAAPLSP